MCVCVCVCVCVIFRTPAECCYVLEEEEPSSAEHNTHSKPGSTIETEIYASSES